MSDILAQYGINLQDIKESITQVYSLKARATFGVFEDPMFTHMIENSTMSYEDLQILINKTLQLFHLTEPIMSLFSSSQEHIKVSEIIEKLLKGKYYETLQEQNPVWLLTNRQTQLNIKIILASVILRCSKILELHHIKEAMKMFTIEENKDRTQGIPLTTAKIIQVLKGLNMTLSTTFLENWIKTNKFDVEGLMLPHQFLYLITHCSDRSAYLKMLPKANYKRVKNPHTLLYEIQPIKQIIGTPDFKIQQKLKEAVTESFQKEVLKEKANDQKTNRYKIIEKSSKNISQIKVMLRDENLFDDIKHCLRSKLKSGKVSDCLTKINSTAPLTRPQTAMHPIKMNEIVNSQSTYFDFGFKNILAPEDQFLRPRTNLSKARKNNSLLKRYQSSYGYSRAKTSTVKQERHLFSHSFV